MRRSPARAYREIIVFFPDACDFGSPSDCARALISAVSVGRAEVGVDFLTAAVEMRLFYDPALLHPIRVFLHENQIPFEVDCR